MHMNETFISALETNVSVISTDNCETDVTDKKMEVNEVCAPSTTTEECNVKTLLYGVTDTPPIHVTVICALQQTLLSLSSQLVVSALVAEAVCASDNNDFKARLLSSTLFMSGVTTIVMNLFGTRLPMFQGAASEYVVPLLLLVGDEGTFCSSSLNSANMYRVEASKMTNSSMNLTNKSEMSLERIEKNVRALQGGLLAAGAISATLGLTGLIGVLLKFVGPLTIVPTMILVFISFVNPVLKFVETNWAISFSTIVVAVILFLYLAKYNTPVLVWTPSGGFRIVKYPVHQVFSILISIAFNWALCGILTKYGVFTNDPGNIGYKARTDARVEIIRTNPWFTFPYPGQFGPVSFSGAAFLSSTIGAFIGILDSIGDYYACSKVCRVPTPPKHAVNRGIMMGGICTAISGAVGSGHGTATYGGNIGAIGVTKVASRQVFVLTGIFYILFGVFGKFSALFIMIPYPVLGGAIVVMFGIFFGVVISNLEVTNMSAPRNISILGISVFIGLTVPTWVQKVKMPIKTSNIAFDRIMAMLLGNPTLIGTCLACFLDNTVPGSAKDRGIEAWQKCANNEMDTVDRNIFNEGYEVYQPLFPSKFLKWSCMKYVPFLPYQKPATVVKEVNDNVPNGCTV